MKRTFYTFSALALASLLTACSTTMPSAPDSSSAPSAAQLEAYHWDLSTAFDARGQAQGDWLLARRKPLRLNFSAGQRLSVQELCNVMNAGYRLEGERITLSAPASTLRACADPALMALERRVGAQLPQAQTLALAAGATPRLTLSFADGSRWVFAGQPTAQTRYASAPERVFLEVAPERVACNHGLMKNAQCLRVREIRYADNGVKQSMGPWQLFYGQIEGWQHQPGVRQLLRLDRYRVKNPPADASSLAYVLDMVVETEQVKP